MLNSCVRMRLKEQKEALEQMGYKDMARCYHNFFVRERFIKKKKKKVIKISFALTRTYVQ